MPEYQLYCFAQSGNAYRAALMLNLIGADWKPVWVDFFGRRDSARRSIATSVNEMGEVPVLVHGDKEAHQSGVILTYLAERTGKFKPQGEDEELEALRWIIFDNQKVNGFLGPYRFLKNFAKPAGDPAVMAFLKAPHRRQSRHRQQAAGRSGRSCSATGRPSPTFRCCAISIIRRRSSASTSPRIIRRSRAWLERMKALPGWEHPYELMPGYPFGTQGYRNR